MFQLALRGVAALALIVLVAASSAARAADRYSFDSAHTNLAFMINHLGFSKVIGRFDAVEGSIVLDEQVPENSTVNVVIQSASINTHHAKRDEHLRSADFFDAANHPTITFESQIVERIGAKTARVHGQLTLLGVSQMVTLFMSLNQVAESPLREGLTIAGFSGRTQIKRSDFGMIYGVPVLGDEIEVLLEIEAHKQ